MSDSCDLQSEASVRFEVEEVDSGYSELRLELSLQPDREWRKGNQIHRAAPHRKYVRDGFSFEQRESSCTNIGSLIEKLVNRLEPDLDVIENYSKSGSCEVAVAVALYVHSRSPVFYFPPSLIELFARLRCSFDVDLYCLR